MSMEAEASPRRPRAILAATCLVLAGSAGCGSTRMSHTSRTGTEQLLLTNAWDQALGQVDFRPLIGVPVFLETSYLEAIDKGWVTSSLRQAMLAQGVLLREEKEDAQWIVEPRTGAYGTDDSEMLIGIPQMNVPATIPGLPAGSVPEIPLIKKSDQHAVTKLALFAYDRASGQLVWNSGTVIGASNDKNLHIGGLGPIQSGSIRGGTEFVGVKIPMTAHEDEQAPHEQGGGAVPFSEPAIRGPAEVLDRDDFLPR
ncbi:DUF6655 family protein [Tautonia plasticadhaerens]|uniref:Uncharacterized protein n=1 Tax=Tautonia plasticadhaerens TaxID=2527974 RepID=A0A518H4Y9_9BACT|nr:DUF6655 family protein [Tautonia plasticadhaerens]QDV35893.1 hypothetical protein ElP_38010 [Tautonia plasticadhaerens]